MLVDADRSSLFFVERNKVGKKILVSKVFDPYTGTNCLPATRGTDNVVKIPWGQGIIGHVAASGEIVNLVDASKASCCAQMLKSRRGITQYFYQLFAIC